MNGRAFCFSLLLGRGAVDVTPPGLPSQKTARVVWGVYFLTVPPSGGVVPRVWWSAWHRMTQAYAKTCTPGELASARPKAPPGLPTDLPQSSRHSRKAEWGEALNLPSRMWAITLRPLPGQTRTLGLVAQWFRVPPDPPFPLMLLIANNLSYLQPGN